MIGPIVFSHDFMVYVSIAIVAGVWYFLRHTRAGMILRAVGEKPTTPPMRSATASGGSACWRSCFGGACAGMGGAYLEP